MAVAGQLPFGQTTYGAFARDPLNQPVLAHAARKRKNDVMSKYSKALLALQELDAVLQAAGPAAAGQVLQQAQTGVLMLHQPVVPPVPVVGPAVDAQPPAIQRQLDASWSEVIWQHLCLLCGPLFITLTSKIVTGLVIMIFPQLITKFIGRFFKTALVAVASEAAGAAGATAAAAATMVDNAIAQSDEAIASQDLSFNFGLAHNSSAPTAQPPLRFGWSMIGAFSTFIFCRVAN